MVDALSEHLVPDALWELVEPLLPSSVPRRKGGGPAPVDQRAVFTAVVYVLTSGCAWRMLPPSFGVTAPTAHRRFTIWTGAGVRRRLYRAMLDEWGGHGLIDWSRAVIDAESVWAKRGDMTAPSPVDRAKSGSKIHVLSDRAGIPLSVGISAANTNDAGALRPLVRAVPAVRSRHGPRWRRPAKLHADKAYDITDLRRLVGDRGIKVRIARKGIEFNDHLGRHRGSSNARSWLTGYHRLNIRYGRNASHFCAFLTLAATLTCYKKLAKAKSAT
ncbi:IS5 family transposase [Nocardia sp. NPDC052278]|uniref:IS5 family transposase n=1 Tax=unclassified Nocardia TaxID=2637762 RepID=UPI0036A770E1